MLIISCGHHMQLHERVIRMNIAMELLQGSHNECWPDVKKKVEAFWKTVNRTKINMEKSD